MRPGRIAQSLIKLTQVKQQVLLQFCNFVMRFCLHCLAFCVEFELSQTMQNKTNENHLNTRKSFTST